MITRSDVSTYSSSSLASAEADVVHAGAAVLLRHRDAEQAELGHPAEDALAIETVLAIVLADVRRHLARAPFANRLLEKALLFVQAEIRSWSDRRWVAKAGRDESLSRAAGATCTAAPRPQPSARGRAGAAGGDLQVIGAAEQRADLARRRRRRRSTPPAAPDAGRRGCRADRAGQRLERLPVDVGDEVAEAIDPHHLAVDAIASRRAAAASRADASRPPGGRAPSGRCRWPATRRPARNGRGPRTSGSPSAARISARSAPRCASAACSSRTAVRTPLSGATNR